MISMKFSKSMKNCNEQNIDHMFTEVVCYRIVINCFLNINIRK